MVSFGFYNVSVVCLPSVLIQWGVLEGYLLSRVAEHKMLSQADCLWNSLSGEGTAACGLVAVTVLAAAGAQLVYSLFQSAEHPWFAWRGGNCSSGGSDVSDSETLERCPAVAASVEDILQPAGQRAKCTGGAVLMPRTSSSLLLQLGLAKRTSAKQACSWEPS